jgi:hypothetical protein
MSKRTHRLSRADSLWLRAGDGLLGPEEAAELEQLGEDAARARRRVLRLQALLVPHEQPELADGVLTALGLSTRPLDLSADATPELADGVLAALGLAARPLDLSADSTPELADGVLAALGLAARPLDLSADATPELADGVLAALGLSPRPLDLSADATPELADGVLASLGLSTRPLDLSADSTPELADGVLASLGLSTRPLDLSADATPELADGVLAAIGAAARDQTNVVPLFPVGAAKPATPARARTWRRMVPAVAMAAAALFTLFVDGPWVEGSSPDFLYGLSSANRVEILEITTHGDAVVSFIQAEEDAPTIIFIDEGAEDELLDGAEAEGL